MEINGIQLTIESVVSILFIVVALSAFILTVAFYIGHKRDSKRKTKESTGASDGHSGKYFNKTKL